MRRGTALHRVNPMYSRSEVTYVNVHLRHRRDRGVPDGSVLRENLVNRSSSKNVTSHDAYAIVYHTDYMAAVIADLNGRPAAISTKHLAVRSIEIATVNRPVDAGRHRAGGWIATCNLSF